MIYLTVNPSISIDILYSLAGVLQRRMVTHQARILSKVYDGGRGAK